MEERSVRIDYTNYRGERRERIIAPLELRFEPTEWHPEAQWILYAIDRDAGALRGFAMKDVHSWEPVHG